MAIEVPSASRRAAAVPMRPNVPVSPEDRRSAALTRRYLACRRRRADMLGCSLFIDPAWDILLDLFASRIEGRSISVSSACIASGVPNSTALRWIGELEAHGLVVRSRDQFDGRRMFLQIVDVAAVEVQRWIDTTFSRTLA